MTEIVVHPVSGEIEFEALIRRSRAQTKFTFAVKAKVAGFSGRQLCLITVPDGEVDRSDYFLETADWPTVAVAVAVATTRGPITTIDSQVTLDPIVSFDEPIEISTLLEAVALTVVQRHAISYGAEYGRKLPPATSRHLLEAVLSAAGTQRADVETLLSQLHGGVIVTGTAGSALAEQRDAVMLAAEIFDSDEVRPALRFYESPSDSSAPFLAGLRNTTHQLEDVVVASDARNFLGWATAEEVHASAMTFQDDGRVLTIVNANKAPLERLTGADLIYYNHGLGSYVFVQYKMMNRSSDRWIYRPDEQFAAERARLRQIQDAHASLRPAVLDVESYRLSEAVTYFKFCKRNAVFDSSDSRMMPGYYVADEYLGLHLSRFPGIHGGQQVTDEELSSRALHGSGFARLVAAGLIGTRVSTSAEITRVIQASLAGDRSVVFAMETSRRPVTGPE
ncbi:hypothetical protein [Microbacterium sp. PMB16]|uniref:hypothetical protein n=1 Tax=Microbacterium sp. PMB16 TaxID=3120157 RepID=UPI003F4C9BD9